MSQCLDTTRELSRAQIANCALLFDVDGTLLDIAPRPDAVHVPTELRVALERLRPIVDGALALVSGRAIESLDALFSPLVLPIVGVHGAERRDADGSYWRAGDIVAALDPARAKLAMCLRDWHGCLLEDKAYGVAVHYRDAPQYAPQIHATLSTLAASMAADFTVLAGKCVYELKSARFTKATGIRALLETAPFKSRKPIFLGDDVTDEAGFELVNELGGMSIRIGSGPTHAHHCIDAVQDVRTWLARVTASQETTFA